jgi:hypothetical protein
MTPNEAELWAKVYAAVMQGLLSNPDTRHAWEELRVRASAEATFVIRTLRHGVL